MSGSGYTIDCSANRGRAYRVAFDADDKVQTVRTKVWTSNVHHHWRMIWNTSYGSEMSTTVACAIRAAYAKRNGEEHTK